MRIVFLSPHSDPQAKLGEPDAGGQCVYEHELALGLASQGHEVLTFCRQRNRHPSVSRIAPGYTIYRITTGGEGFIPKEEIAAYVPEFTDQVSQILAERRPKTPTLIHAHYWDGAMAAMQLKANYANYPLVWTPHSLGFTKRDKFKGINYEANHHFIPRLMWENYCLTVADKVICSTRDEKRKILKYYHSFAERIDIIPPGVTIGSASSADRYRRQMKIRPGTKILLCLGRMARTKGYQHAIRIIQRLHSRTETPFVLVIVGGGTKISSDEESKYLSELKRLAAKLGVSDRVIFHPSVPHHQVQSLYSLADFYLMTAEEEPFGLTVIEAMAAECVVLAHNRGGTKNIITHNSTGMIVDMHKYSNVADVLARLIASPSKMAKISDRARATVLSKYSWESRLPQFIKSYSGLSPESTSRFTKLLATDRFLRSITTPYLRSPQINRLPVGSSRVTPARLGSFLQSPSL